MTGTPTTAFQLAQDAMTTLQFYRNYYASGADYYPRLTEVIALLRNRAESYAKDGSNTGYSEFKFLMMFAASLELSSKAEEYKPFPGASA